LGYFPAEEVFCQEEGQPEASLNNPTQSEIEEFVKECIKEKKSSFKRFELSYESLWFAENYWESVYQAAAGPEGSYNSKARSRLDVYKIALYLTPKTDIEYAFATGHYRKGTPAWVDEFGTVYFGSITGQKIQFWNIDLCQNIFAHRKSGISFDALAGYTNFEERIRIKYDSGLDPQLSFNRRYKGWRVGAKAEFPFRLPILKKNPFVFKAVFYYAPNLSMKNSGFNWSFSNPTLSNSGKGFSLQTRLGLSCQLISDLSIEAAYNYWKFQQKRSGYDAPLISGMTLHKTKTKLYGPSLGLKYIF
jgi:hypothetical protein